MTKTKTRKVKDCGYGKIKLMELRVRLYKRKNIPVSSGEVQEKTSPRGEPGFF